MSSFNFDPFAAPTPAAATPPTTGNAAASSAAAAGRSSASSYAATPAAAPAPAAPGIVNPFDNFSFFQTTAGGGTSGTNNASNKPLGNNNTDWQQSARAVMSRGSGVWNNVGATLTQNPMASVPSMGGMVPPANPPPPRSARRIVPYASPISTLESNWDPWLYAAQSTSPKSLWGNGGNFSTYLIVRANDACCLSGGVESVLRWSKQQQRAGKAGFGSDSDLGTTFDSMSITESPGNGGAGYGGVQGSNSNLSASDASGFNTSGRIQKAPSSGGVGGSMRFLKSGLKKAQQSIERSVTTIAIKADGGKNPDQLCVSLHYLGGMNNGNGNGNVNLSMWKALGMNNGMVGGGVNQDLADVCLSRTDWVELPSAPGNGDGEGLLFSIPLCLPDLSFLEAAAANNGGGDCGVKLTIRLYIRSGATLLKAVANREYCIGESVIAYSNLMQLVQPQQQSQQQPSSGRCGNINVPFTTGMLAETSNSSYSSSQRSQSFHSTGSMSSGGGDAPAALHITATPRIKFNPLCTYGWSLTDPYTTTPEGPKSWLKMFQLPLDQAYVFSLAHHHQLLNSNQRQYNSPNPAILLSNERGVESSLVLPLATACARLFSSAASHSQTLAMNTYTKTKRREAVYLLPPGTDESRLDTARAQALLDRVEGALQDGCADVELGVVALVLLGGETQLDFGFLGGAAACGVGLESSVPSVKTSLSFQPPHSIFEESLTSGSCPLLDEASGAQYINSFNNGAPGGTGPNAPINMRFCPRILTGSDDLLPGLAGTKPSGMYLGNIRLEVQVGYTNARDNISTGISGGTAIEGLVELEPYLNAGTGGKVPVMAPAIDSTSGRRIGTFVLLVRVNSANNGNNPITPRSSLLEDNAASASQGLVSLVGLSTLTEHLGIAPFLDCDAPQQDGTTPTPEVIRRRQVATMGSFVNPRFLEHQSNVVRKGDASSLKERFEAYFASLVTPSDNEIEEPLFKRRAPRPFRPSNSRGDAMLSGIGFNVNVQSLSLNILQENETNPHVRPAAVTQSVTHGAPADHARGFGGPQKKNADEGTAGDVSSKDSSAPRGGLRRLESWRLEMAKELDDSVMGLITAVGEHFKSRSQAAQHSNKKPSRHIPPNLPAIMHYRSKSMESSQRLHALTWDIAVRRANCFSQALGIAVTSYLTSLSDGGPGWSRGFAGVWARHGYLLVFEGLLSAVGKELGMIEDAAIAISMLRMVSVVLMPDDGANSSNTTKENIPVPLSPYVRWVNLTPQQIPSKANGASSAKTQYCLEIGLDPSYYQSRVPDSLKGIGVRFYPILFQMGVDIRQWGVNAGRNAMIQMKDKSRGNTSDFVGDIDTEAGDTEQIGGSIIDDDDEDEEGDNTAGAAGNEILMALNVEGYRKLNSYAHSVNPTSPGMTAATVSPPMFDSFEQTSPQQVPQQQLPIHPTLVSLSEAIKVSADKMEHAVLDRAATACQRFGGGSTVFCKSGKDRTAMQVTFKQAQFVQRVMDRKDHNKSSLLEDTPISYDEVFDKSTLMRKHGNRIPICEKNTGEPKFAFNPLQRKFMPEMLRPEAALCTWSKPET